MQILTYANSSVEIPWYLPPRQRCRGDRRSLACLPSQFAMMLVHTEVNGSPASGVNFAILEP